MRWLYLLLCAAGTAIPLNAILPWFLSHGPDVGAFVQAISRSRVASFGWLDLLITGAVTLVYIRVEGRRLRMRRLWIPALATCALGVSCGLPLFLAMREWALERVARESETAP